MAYLMKVLDLEMTIMIADYDWQVLIVLLLLFYIWDNNV